MKTAFQPQFRYTKTILRALKEIDTLNKKIASVHLTHDLLLKEQKKNEAELACYFRFIEESPESELHAYLEALVMQKRWVEKKLPVTIKRINRLHGILMHKKSDSSFRKTQNAIYNWKLTKIYYLPPKPHAVPGLMKELVYWINHAEEFPCPIVASIAHFGLNSIHPYSDGNGRTARLLTRWILGLGGYHVKELYCLERLYAKDLLRYYDALSLGDVKSYEERARNVDITSWIEYFCKTMEKAYIITYNKIKGYK